jgi:hypothetical protein
VNGSPALSPGEITTRLMGQFPLGMIPTFFLLLILHLIALLKIRQSER